MSEMQRRAEYLSLLQREDPLQELQGLLWIQGHLSDARGDPIEGNRGRSIGAHPVKPATAITDRAKRYRANRNPPPGPRRCTFCARRKNVDIDHVTGDETDDSPANKMYLCRPCNTAKGIVQARNRIGTRTRQFNPHTIKVPTFAEFKHHAAVLLGVIPGDAAQATAAIHATPPEKRAAYSGRIESANPFRSEAQERKFFAMASRGEISQATLKKFMRDNPAAPTYAQYGFAVASHQRGAHDEGGAIIHATPASVRHRYALKIAETKRQRRGNPLFAPQERIDVRKHKSVRYGLEVDITGRGQFVEQGLFDTKRQAETEGRRIAKKEGMRYHVKVTRDRR